MKSFHELRNTYDITNQDLLRYRTSKDKVLPIIKTLSINVVPKAVSIQYCCLMESKEEFTMYVRTKWEQKLCEEICGKIGKLQHNLRSGENLLGIIKSDISPQIKSKQLKIQQPCWKLYNHMDLDYAHTSSETVRKYSPSGM